ncbi:MAG: ABC transporter permease [Acidobacteria bacterium]|nr:ABC transporter permease [Acidobacteriota bacterium]
MNRFLFPENLRMAFEALLSHQLRSGLTILGIVIGILTVVTVSSLLGGMRNNIVQMVEEYGTDNIYVFHLSMGVQLGHRDRSETSRVPLKPEDAAVLKSASSAISEVSYSAILRGNNTVKSQDATYRRAQLQGVSSNQAITSSAVLREGRYLSGLDDLHRNSVCVIGSAVAEALFPEEGQVAGRSLLLEGKKFTVIGVLEQRKTSFFGEAGQDNLVLIPYRTLQKTFPNADWLLLTIRARKGQLAQALEDTEQILRRLRGVRYSQPNNFDITTSEKLIRQFDALTATVGVAALAISAIGLLVGGIGVMNVMLVSVRERSREIGVRKAVGATSRDILTQFLFESMTLTGIGGLLGFLLSVVAMRLMVWFFPWLPTAFSTTMTIAALLLSITVGLLFGVWPAARAARLDPVESLRYE